ncbi:MAG: hypothetical protein GX894_04330 [Clostridia bacterium]|nr:hypothetical protein [Clostridia bacterium]
MAVSFKRYFFIINNSSFQTGRGGFFLAGEKIGAKSTVVRAARAGFFVLTQKMPGAPKI